MKCAYCGKKDIDDHLIMADKSLEVCSAECCQKTGEYLERDKKYKLWLFLSIFVAAVGVIISALTYNSIFAYAAQFIFGVVLILYPYPITNASTFRRCCIKTTKRVCLVIGICFILWSIALFALLPDAIFTLRR